MIHKFIVLSFGILLLYISMSYADTQVYCGDYDDRMQYYELASSNNKTVTDDIDYYKKLATGICLI